MSHILVVEDDAQFCTMITQMLSHDGHRVSVAGNGEEGMLRVAESRPELIITDILMPGTDGIDLIMSLNRQDAGIPVIAMSGGRRSIRADFNLESASLLGVKATLSKPFTRAQLREAIQIALA